MVKQDTPNTAPEPKTKRMNRSTAANAVVAAIEGKTTLGELAATDRRFGRQARRQEQPSGRELAVPGCFGNGRSNGRRQAHAADGYSRRAGKEVGGAPSGDLASHLLLMRPLNRFRVWAFHQFIRQLQLEVAVAARHFLQRKEEPMQLVVSDVGGHRHPHNWSNSIRDLQRRRYQASGQTPRPEPPRSMPKPEQKPEPPCPSLEADASAVDSGLLCKV